MDKQTLLQDFDRIQACGSESYIDAGQSERLGTHKRGTVSTGRSVTRYKSRIIMQIVVRKLNCFLMIGSLRTR